MNGLCYRGNIEMPAISVENVSKRFRKGQAGYRTLREDICNLTGRLTRARGSEGASKNYMWALRDVSFQVEPGEKLGIIGPNGSGKTTLLRLLAGITRPTKGKISLKGRLGVLIELMAGFHPELTGRENVYLNGAIMGMARAEIRRKFDEIVDFAGVGEWIETPIKRYSTGMQVRLGFAVAAHLEPDILLVDEVLAVGDTAFQNKCLGKMGDVAREGRTVVFVSHNMAAVRSLCNRGIVLNQGSAEFAGPMGEAIYYYQGLMRGRDIQAVKRMQGLQVVGLRVSPGSSRPRFTSDGPLVAEMDFFTDHPLPACYLNFVIEDGDGRFLVHSRTDLFDLWPSFGPGLHRVRVDVPRLGLRGGVYTLWFRLYVAAGGVTEMADSDRAMLEVDGPQVGGLVDVPCSWSWTEVKG